MKQKPINTTKSEKTHKNTFSFKETKLNGI